MTVRRLIKQSGRQRSGYSDLAVSSLNLMLKPCNGFICPRHVRPRLSGELCVLQDSDNFTGRILVRTDKMGPIIRPAHANRPERPSKARNNLDRLVIDFRFFATIRRIAAPKRMGSMTKINVNNAEKSGVDVLRARIICVRIVTPLPTYRRPAEIPVQ